MGGELDEPPNELVLTPNELVLTPNELEDIYPWLSAMNSHDTQERRDQDNLQDWGNEAG